VKNCKNLPIFSKDMEKVQQLPFLAHRPCRALYKRLTQPDVKKCIKNIAACCQSYVVNMNVLVKLCQIAKHIAVNT